MPGERREELLIKGGMLLDGCGGEAERKDLLVGKDGLVSAVGKDLSAKGAEVLEASGLYLAPGFVDLHSHSDLYSTIRPADGGATDVPIGDAPKLLQGCTAQTFGQDGISAAPVDDDHLADHAAMLAGLDGTIPAESWSWRSTGEYLARLAEVSATRSFALVGHSTLRALVMGYDARPPSADELDEMRLVLRRELEAGASGFSSGLVYVPAAYSDLGELIALCEVAAEAGKPFFVHVRSESDRVEEATDEVIEAAARTGCHLHYSHIKTAGASNWHKASSLLRKIEAARGSGVSITSDIHPYTAGSTTANVLLPPWVFEGGGVAAGLKRLADPSVRRRMRSQLLSDTTSWDNWFAFSGGFRGLKVASASRPGAAGRYLSELIESAGVADLESEAAFDVLFDFLSAERLRVTIVSFNNVEENIAKFLAAEHCSVGSDGVVNPDGHPHPRLYGTFPRVLGRFVRELGVVPLEEAVAKMTSKAAAVIGQEGLIGELKPELPADLVVFDPLVIADQATYESPRTPPIGIEAVLVAGRKAVEGGRLVRGTIPPVGEDV